MEFVVFERGKRRLAAQGHPFAVLVRDNWDDYGFRTSFFLEVHTTDRRTIQLGTVKILRRGQPEGPTQVPTYLDEGLDSEYCSLGQSLSYYEGLKELGPEIYVPVLRGLRDVIFRPSIRDSFANEPGFSKSLERSGSSIRALEDAAGLFDLRSDVKPESDGRPLHLQFESNVGGSSFILPLRFNDSSRLPDRINAVIGYNGTGKTHLLANLAMVAQADPRQREGPEFSGRYGAFLSSESIPFGSVIAVSYSAFDTFEVPGRTPQEREHLERSGDVRGYAYCGLRSFTTDNGKSSDTEPHRLKSISEISREFFRSLSRIHEGRGRRLLDKALVPIAQDPSFQRLSFEPSSLYQKQFRTDLFPSLSTGHKIVLNMIVQLVTNLQRRSLVLIDEPESHLHPPLLAALLRGITILLNERDSFAVVATHAPLVLQEIPKRYVKILRRFDDLTLVHEPEIETFGENLGLLTRHIFNLDSSSTDYQGVLRRLAETLTLDEIDGLFDEGMSVQARSYVASVRRARA
ncbi:AAA family ATPase [Micromonospora sp. NPDC049523]|uniref:AAA family ATPase n=1 Tax=Micromonospora sp. NPDC049523 TaxID=3155921 RepID=UPI003434FC7D